MIRLAAVVIAMARVVQPYPGGNPALEAVIDATWPAQLRAEALDVAHCESRGRAGAKNGQHKGLFQMGRAEWVKYGQGNDVFDPFDNAAAAFRMWTDRGWRAWECQPRRGSVHAV